MCHGARVCGRNEDDGGFIGNDRGASGICKVVFAKGACPIFGIARRVTSCGKCLVMRQGARVRGCDEDDGGFIRNFRGTSGIGKILAAIGAFPVGSVACGSTGGGGCFVMDCRVRVGRWGVTVIVARNKQAGQSKQQRE